MTKTETPSLFRLVVVALVAAMLFPLGAQTASLEEIKERGYMRIATEDNYAPFEFMKNGEPTGYNNDVVAELTKYADFEIRQDIMPWRGLLASVASGKYDAAITGSIVTEERLRVFDFTMPYASAQHYCIKRAGDESIKRTEDLASLTLGIQAGSALLARLPELEAMLAKTGGNVGEVVEYTSYPEIYRDLAVGRIDYTINTIVNAQNLIAKRPDVFALCGPVTGPSYIAYPVPEGNDELLAFLNGFISHLRETGRLAELQQKWFGQSFPDLPREAITSFEQYKKMTGRG